jgi:hypothetical protein
MDFRISQIPNIINLYIKNPIYGKRFHDIRSIYPVFKIKSFPDRPMGEGQMLSGSRILPGGKIVTGKFPEYFISKRTFTYFTKNLQYRDADKRHKEGSAGEAGSY